MAPVGAPGRSTGAPGLGVDPAAGGRTTPEGFCPGATGLTEVPAGIVGLIAPLTDVGPGLTTPIGTEAPGPGRGLAVGNGDGCTGLAAMLPLGLDTSWGGFSDTGVSGFFGLTKAAGLFGTGGGAGRSGATAFSASRLALASLSSCAFLSFSAYSGAWTGSSIHTEPFDSGSSVSILGTLRKALFRDKL